MQIETPLKQRTETAQHGTRVRREAYCEVSDNTSAMPDDGRAPVWSHVINRLLAGYCNETEGEAYLKAPAKRVAAADAPSRHIQIEVLERLSDTSICRALAGRDPLPICRPGVDLLPRPHQGTLCIERRDDSP